MALHFFVDHLKTYIFEIISDILPEICEKVIENYLQRIKKTNKFKGGTRKNGENKNGKKKVCEPGYLPRIIMIPMLDFLQSMLFQNI